MGRIIEGRGFESINFSTIMLSALFFIVFPSSGKAVTVTVENDGFVRCLIGDCRDTNTGYSEIQDPFNSVIFGTDLGTFAAGETYTYMFLGDTCEDQYSCSDLDPYLKIPNGDALRFYITASQGDIAGHEAEFLDYLQHEFNDPFDYLYGWDSEFGFHVPTGAFYNTTNHQPYVYYGLAVDGNYPNISNSDRSILLRYDYPSLFYWTPVVLDSASGSSVLSQGPGFPPGYGIWNWWAAWYRPPNPPNFELGKFVNIAPVSVNTSESNALAIPVSPGSQCTLYSSEQALLLFGTGKYRDSSVYLAMGSHGFCRRKWNV
jgi:hypothetical protein